RLAAGGLDLLGRRVDGALEIRVRLGGLRHDRDIRPVVGRAQCDRQSEPPTAAAHDDRTPGQRACGNRARTEVAVTAHRSSPSSDVDTEFVSAWMLKAR